MLVNPHNSGLAAGFGVLPSSVELHIKESDLPKAETILSDFSEEFEGTIPE